MQQYSLHVVTKNELQIFQTLNMYRESRCKMQMIENNFMRNKIEFMTSARKGENVYHSYMIHKKQQKQKKKIDFSITIDKNRSP